MKATLYLCDGSSFTGQVFGATKSVVGEIGRVWWLLLRTSVQWNLIKFLFAVFQTGMVGYVDSLTDPSYAEQLLTLTYPIMGNYGVPSAKEVDANGLPNNFESDRVWPAALIVDRSVMEIRSRRNMRWREKNVYRLFRICPENEHSHWKAVESLSSYLRKAGVPGLSGIDVRMLTKKIRDKGAMKAKVALR